MQSRDAAGILAAKFLINDLFREGLNLRSVLVNSSESALSVLVHLTETRPERELRSSAG